MTCMLAGNFSCYSFGAPLLKLVEICLPKGIQVSKLIGILNNMVSCDGFILHILFLKLSNHKILVISLVFLRLILQNWI